MTVMSAVKTIMAVRAVRAVEATIKTVGLVVLTALRAVGSTSVNRMGTVMMAVTETAAPLTLYTSVLSMVTPTQKGSYRTEAMIS